MMLQMSYVHENTMDMCSQVSQRFHHVMCSKLKKELLWLKWSHLQEQTWLDRNQSIWQYSSVEGIYLPTLCRHETECGCHVYQYEGSGWHE